MWVVLQMNKPRASLRGYCRQFLLEPSPNLFVGRANRPLAEDLMRKLEESGIDAVMVRAHSKSDLGMAIKIYGNPHRQVVNLDGFQAIMRKIK